MSVYRTLVILSVLALSQFYSFAIGQRLTATFKDTVLTNADEHELLDRYIRELKLYDITLNVPDSMHSIDMRGRQYICNNISKDWNDAMLGNDVYKVALETNSGDAIFLFPTLIFAWPKYALRVAYCIGTELTMSHKDRPINVLNNVEIIPNTDKGKYSGADTIITYRLDFEVPFIDKYKYCLGVYLRSYAHNALPLKIVLTENGLKNADNYLNVLFRIIEIGSNPHPDFLDVENATRGEKDLF